MRFSFRLIVTSLVFALTIISGDLHSSAQQEESQMGNFSELTLDITSNKGAFLRLEPVPIILTLSNKTTLPVLGHTALDFSANHVELYVGRDGGGEQKVQNFSPARVLVSVNPKVIKPGERLELKQLLSFELDKIFPLPGTYKVRAALRDVSGLGEVKSKNLTVRIVEAEGIDRLAFDYIKSKPYASSFFNGLDLVKSEQALADAEQFAIAFESSEYGNYMNFRLGTLYFAKEDYHKAKQQFLKLLTKEGFAFEGEAADYLKKAKNKLGELVDTK